jgi:hypothetical protein
MIRIEISAAAYAALTSSGPSIAAGRPFRAPQVWPSEGRRGASEGFSETILRLSQVRGLMASRSRGPLLSDIKPGLLAAKAVGAKEFCYEVDGTPIVIRLQDAETPQVAAPRTEAKPTNSSPTQPARRINPVWERWSNDPERTRLRREWHDLNVEC